MRGFRRSAAVACVAVAALVVTALVAPAGAAEDFIPGSGQASARVVRIGPNAARLSFAPTIGMAFSDYTNTVGRAGSRVFDFAALDSSLPPEFTSHAPPEVRVDSTDEGAADGKSTTTAGLPAGSPLRAGGTVQSARATGDPDGESFFTIGDFAPVPGQVEMSGATATSRTGVVDGKRRQAMGAVSIGRLALGGGAVVMEGLEWEVHQHTGSGPDAGGSFTVKGIKVAGQSLAPPSADQVVAAFVKINDALKPLGIRLDAPVVTVDHDIASITPLGLHLFASQVGTTAGAPLVGGLQPVRDPVASALISANPQVGSLVTVGDIAIGALAGTGSLDIQLGGASAFTEGERFADPFGSFDLGQSAGLGAVSLGGDSPSYDVGSPEPTRTKSSPTTLAAKSSAKRGAMELAGARTQKGSTGGPAAMVGLVGLLATLSMGGADWWRLRHAPRTIAP